MWSRRERTIPIAGSSQFRGAARRTRIVRLTLGGLVAALAAASIAFANDLRPAQSVFFPRGASGIVVLDLSTSIEPSQYRKIGLVLERLAASDASIGLVIFSDIAYELLPPGTPAQDLRPFLRFFAPREGRLPTNPWQATFRGGTRISDGLALARTMLARDHVTHGSVLLVSDLETAVSDVPALTRLLIDFRTAGVPLRIVGLAPLRDDLFFFRNILGAPAFVEPLAAAQSARASFVARTHATDPRWLVIAGSVLVLLLAANERWCGRLVLPRKAPA